jgi:hypothetical protein
MVPRLIERLLSSAAGVQSENRVVPLAGNANGIISQVTAIVGRLVSYRHSLIL